MFFININEMLFIVITAILLIALMAFISFIYHTKRKFNSIDKYNELVAEKMKTYKSIQKQYNKNLYDSGIKLKKNDKIVAKFFKTVIKKMGGSK